VTRGALVRREELPRLKKDVEGAGEEATPCAADVGGGRTGRKLCREGARGAAVVGGRRVGRNPCRVAAVAGRGVGRSGRLEGAARAAPAVVGSLAGAVIGAAVLLTPNAPLSGNLGRDEVSEGRVEVNAGRGEDPGEKLAGLGEALNGRGEALTGLGEALNGLGEALTGLGEALKGLGEALKGLGEALKGLAEDPNGRGEVADDDWSVPARPAVTSGRCVTLPCDVTDPTRERPLLALKKLPVPLLAWNSSSS